MKFLLLNWQIFTVAKTDRLLLHLCVIILLRINYFDWSLVSENPQRTNRFFNARGRKLFCQQDEQSVFHDPSKYTCLHLTMDGVKSG